jgi:hypothetical protein
MLLLLGMLLGKTGEHFNLAKDADKWGKIIMII